MLLLKESFTYTNSLYHLKHYYYAQYGIIVIIYLFIMKGRRALAIRMRGILSNACAPLIDGMGVIPSVT